MSLVSATECNQLNPNQHPLTDANVCAGYLNHHTCLGDSGGPLQCKGGQTGSGQWVLQGVDSFGPVNCETNAPSTFTNVVKHLEWIEATMKAHGN